MGAVGVGFDACFSNRVPNRSTCLIDEWVVDGASRRVNNAMTIRLEEADLGILGFASDRQAGSMSVSETGHLMRRWVREVGCMGDFEKSRPGLLG